MLLVQQFIEARRSAAQAAADVRKLIDASIELEAAIEPWSRSCHALSMLERHRAVNPVESELTPLTSLTPACGPVRLGGFGRLLRLVVEYGAFRTLLHDGRPLARARQNALCTKNGPPCPPVSWFCPLSNSSHFPEWGGG